MKKLLTLLVCTSVIVITNKTFAQLNKVAIISIYGNRSLSDNPLDKAINEQILKDSSFNLSIIVERFAAYLNDEMIKDFPFPFVPKEDIINNPAYAKLGEVAGASKNNVTYDLVDGKVPLYTSARGYLPIASFGIVDDVKAIKQAFEMLPADVDGVMIAYVSFDLYDQAGMMGVTIKKARAYVNIKIFNREGKRIFKLKDYESSKEGVTGYGGFVLESKKVYPLVSNAFDELLVSMKKKMPKSIAKLAKKIDKSKED